MSKIDIILKFTWKASVFSKYLGASINKAGIYEYKLNGRRDKHFGRNAMQINSWCFRFARKLRPSYFFCVELNPPFCVFQLV